MTPWSAQHIFDVLNVGKRLGVLLLAVTAYCLVAGLLVHWLKVQMTNWGSAASLINTVILGLLMSFRNRAAYERWWEGRLLWGQLVNDSRNLAAKLAANLPADVVGRSCAADVLVNQQGVAEDRTHTSPMRKRGVSAEGRNLIGETDEQG
jgi:predicted membrane chloride channel (bestrophin family)